MSELKREVLRFEGKLGRLESEHRRLDLSIQRMRESLRGLLDPTENVEKMDAEAIVSQASELGGALATLGELHSEISAIKKALRRP